MAVELQVPNQHGPARRHVAQFSGPRRIHQDFGGDGAGRHLKKLHHFTSLQRRHSTPYIAGVPEPNNPSMYSYLAKDMFLSTGVTSFSTSHLTSSTRESTKSPWQLYR